MPPVRLTLASSGCHDAMRLILRDQWPTAKSMGRRSGPCLLLTVLLCVA